MGPAEWIAVLGIVVVVGGACIGWMNAVYKRLGEISSSLAGLVPRIQQAEKIGSDLFRKYENHDTEINELKTAVAVMRGKTA